ncbi:MAG: acyltransferase [Rheinheimera sp.]|nr:MAG: acyltransferase [Rheinheimera sp.]
MQSLSWRDYAARRTGLPVGSRGELRQNLYRSFTASSFGRFWQIWNPLFGFYLQLWLYRPLQRKLPQSLALWLTFVGNGVLHDAVTLLVRQDFVWFFAPWFGLMGAYVLAEKRFGLRLRSGRPTLAICYHSSLLAGTALLSTLVRI